MCCAAILLVTIQGALAAPGSAGAGAPGNPTYGASRPLVLAQANLSSRSNIRRLPAGGIAAGARVQSLKPRATGPVRGIARPTRKVAPGIGNSRFSIDRRRIDNRGLNAGTTDGLKQQVQKRLGKQRLRTKTPNKEIARTRQISPSRLSKTKEQETQPVKRAVKLAVPKQAGKARLQTSVAGSVGSGRVPHHTPEWTNHGDGDPGATGASPGVYAVWLTTGLVAGPQPGSSAGWTHTRGWPVRWEGPVQKAGGAADAGTVNPVDATRGVGFVGSSVGAEPGPVGIADSGTQDIPFVVGRLFHQPGSVPPQDGPLGKPRYFDGGTTQAASFSELQGISTKVDVVEHQTPARVGFGMGTGSGRNEIVRDDTAGGEAASPGHRIGIAHDHQPPTASVAGQRLEFLRLLTVPVQPAPPPFGAGLQQLEFDATSSAQGGGGVARVNTSAFNPHEYTFSKTTGDQTTGDASSRSTPSGAAEAGSVRGYDRTHRVTVGPTHAPTVGAGMTVGAGVAPADSPDRPIVIGRVYNAERSSSQLPEVGDEVLMGFEAGTAPPDPSGHAGVRQQQGRVATDQDHNPAGPGSAASGLPTGKRQHKPVVVTKPIDTGTSAAGGLYEYPGGYAQRFDGVDPSQSQAGEPGQSAGASIRRLPPSAGDVAMEEITLTHEKVERSAQHNQTDLEFVKQRATDDTAGGEPGDVNRPYVIGSLANGKDAGGSASLYVPKQMLRETREAAGGGSGAPGGYAQRFDRVSPDLPRVVVRGWDPVKKAEVESERFSGSYFVTSATHAGATNGADLVAHGAVHGAQQAESPPGGPVPVPYPTAAGSGATAHDSGQAGKPLLVIAEDVEGESGGPHVPWAYFRWSH